MNSYCSCVTLRLRAFVVKGFYCMPSLPGGSRLTSGPTRKSDESDFLAAAILWIVAIL